MTSDELASNQTGASVPGPGRRLPPETVYYAPPANPGALEHVADLLRSGHEQDADAILRMIETPQAVWFSRGDADDVERAVRGTVEQAAAAGATPILVAYNVPGRDCSQYSAGGAPTGAAYRNWIEAFARGLGEARAVVIVEPDGLALMPADCDQPDTFDRLVLLRHAAHVLHAAPGATVYLDAGNSGWHPAAEMATRLIGAGVTDIAGFALNVSNYHRTEDEIRYGTELAASISHAALGDPRPDVHFVVDTSRNGRGPWIAPDDHSDGDPQVWCNPPNRGLGERPTAETGHRLVDAFLWIKIPGESDGEGFRWTNGPIDPVRGVAAPAAGQWFADMAIELARNADPPLPR